jgi:hypothetical protein
VEQHRATEPGAPCLASETWDRSGEDSPPSALATFPRLFRLTLSTSLTLSALLYFLWSWHWPLVGDTSLIHYIAFLIERGWAPYRDLGDMNMPGSYLIELAAMHLFGPGALAWRLFDFTTLAAATAAFFSITNMGGPSFPAPSERVGSASPLNPGAPSMTVASSWVGCSVSRLAPLFASSLFILIHGRDGLAQGGQRDLTMAVLLLAATAFLLVAIRSAGNPSAYAAAFGLLSGIALTIKPTIAPLSLAQLALAIYTLRKLDRPWRAPTLSALLAAFIAPALALGFLLCEHALAAFLAGFHGIVPYYASLGHRPLTYILLHSLSPILSLVILWLLILVLKLPCLNITRSLLLLGVLFGLINCIVQARALPYYRYPLLAFLLPLMAIDFTSAAQTGLTDTLPTKSAAALALAAFAVGALFLAPQSAILIHRYRWYQTDFNTALERDLTALGGPALSLHIQCIDSVSGCNTVLYDLRLEPATGVLSDFLLFGNTTDTQPPESIPIVRDTRAQFTHALLARPPKIIVVTSHLHLSGPDSYAKLDRWSSFAAWLAANYSLSTEWAPTRTTRWWSREELPAGYRIYTLRVPALSDTHSQTRAHP